MNTILFSKVVTYLIAHSLSNETADEFNSWLWKKVIFFLCVPFFLKLVLKKGIENEFARYTSASKG